ncbi:MAG: hypothetical protein ACOYXM_09200 [Actinomycetota bacterium]
MDRDRAARSQRAAAAAFAAYVLFGMIALVFVLADHRWFFRDDWAFLAGRDVSFDGLFQPHFDQHLSAVPVLVFRAMWSLFGAHSYVPYQLLIAVAHLSVVVLLRMLLRHLGVRPWLATGAAAILVLWGPAGGDNLTWAFQVNFTGSISFGLAQLLLADRSGRVGPREVMAATLGVLSVLSSAIGVTMVAVVGLALLLKHGWRTAAVQVTPAALVMLVWAIAMDPATESAAGPPPDIATTLRWIRWTYAGAIEGLGGHPVVVAVLIAVAALGLALEVRAPTFSHFTGARDQLRRRITAAAIPIALLLGSLFFAIVTARGRWIFGEAGARAGRYIYVIAVLMIPVLAIAAEAVSRRWPSARHAVLALLIMPIPLNLGGFDEPPFDARYFARQEALLTGVVEMPLARQVPRENRPPGYDPTMGEGMTVGWLLDAHDGGKLPAAAGRLTPALRDELTIRLTVTQTQAVGPPSDACPPLLLPTLLTPASGAEYRITAPIVLTLEEPSGGARTRVVYRPGAGDTLRLEPAGAAVRAAPLKKADSDALCTASE